MIRRAERSTTEPTERATPTLNEHRVNLLIVASSLWIGGAESVMRHLAQAVDPQRFKVTVCHLKQRGHVGDELARAGVEIVALSGEDPTAVDYLSFVKLFRLVRRRRIDVVHTHTTHGLVDAGLCKMLMPRLKVIHTFHFGNYPHTRSRIMWMEHVFSRVADRLLAVGEVQRQQVQRVFRLSDRRIDTIWNGVTLPTESENPDFRERLGTGTRLLIGTVATLIKQKGLSDFMQVARHVRQMGHNVQFVIVGEGHLRAELEAQRHALDLDDTVVLTGWVVNAAEVALPAVDVFFQPSLWEAMSVVLLEAMAVGKPIVATRVGETPHIIEDGVDGLLVEPADVEGMTAALVRLIEDADLRRHLGAAAKRKIEQRFTVQHMARAYEDVYLSA